MYIIMNTGKTIVLDSVKGLPSKGMITIHLNNNNNNNNNN